MSLFREIDLTKIGGSLLSFGQKAMASSIPVVVASNQSAVPISGSVTTTPPANQTVDVAKVAGQTTDTGTGNVGVGTQRVVLATNQPEVPVGDSTARGYLSTLAGIVSAGKGLVSDTVAQGYLATLAAAVSAFNTARPANVVAVGGFVSPAFTNIRSLEIDSGNGVVQQEGPHHEIHEGMAHSALYRIPATNNNASVNLLIRVGTGEIHMTPTISVDRGAEWFLFAQPTVTGAGTPLTSNNRWRAKQGVAGFVSTSAVYHTPTTTSDGNQIDGDTIGSGSSGSKLGGNSRELEEWVLKSGTDYLVRVTNISGNNGLVGVIKINWYQAHAADGSHVL